MSVYLEPHFVSGTPFTFFTIICTMEATQDAKTWLTFLLSDSAFPGGALANSQGLESAVLHEAVKRDDNKSLLTLINLSLEQVSFVCT